MTSEALRRCAHITAVTALAVSLALALEVLGPTAATWVSDLVYPLVAFGAGTLLILGSRGREGRDRLAWTLFGVGVLLFGTGELAWALLELGLGVEPSFPGIPDVFYLGAYPVLAGAVLVTPRLAANRLQRAQQLLDGLVVAVVLSAVAWMAVLETMYRSAGEVAMGELLVGAAYPVSDVLLVVTVATVGVGRSIHLRDKALWGVIAALLLTAAGDLIYLTQSWSDTYRSGSWVDATWLASYGLFALASAWLPEPVERREARTRRLPLWQLAVPVTAVLALIGYRLAIELTTLEENVAVNVGMAAVALIVLVRILLVIAEDRALVDTERRQLISVVSHELRTPLTAVQGYLDLVLDEWEVLSDADRREMVEVSRDQARMVTRIVTDLVAASRDKLHSTELTLESIPLHPAMREAATSLGLEQRMSISSTPDAAVTADRDRLSQILTNLFSNAERYGRGEIACDARRVNGHVEIAVHDNGEGVPLRYRQTIWDRFERGSHRFDATTPGSGLGLAIVHSLVRAHSGEVGYRTSERLGGACFWFRLPATDMPADQPVPRAVPV